MTESLPHLNTLMKIFEEIFGVQIWKTLYIALKFKNPKNCPKHWGMISESWHYKEGSTPYAPSQFCHSFIGEWN